PAASGKSGWRRRQFDTAALVTPAIRAISAGGTSTASSSFITATYTPVSISSMRKHVDNVNRLIHSVYVSTVMRGPRETAPTPRARRPPGRLPRRSAMSVPTHEVTLYRLSDAAPDLDAFLETLPGTYLDEAGGGDLAFPDYRGATAVALHWRRDPVSAPWVKAATHLIGPLPDRYETLDCGALLLLDVDGDRYAIGFGSGFRAVPDQLKDHGFGLRFTIRAVH